jgi:hypothetical protein
VEGDAVGTIVGAGSALTFTVADAVHELTDPTTVYTVEEAGITTTVPPAIAPGNQVYADAPPAEMVAPVLAQTVGEPPVLVIVGVATTLMAIAAVPEHTPVLPITV